MWSEEMKFKYPFAFKIWLENRNESFVHDDISRITVSVRKETFKTSEMEILESEFQNVALFERNLFKYMNNLIVISRGSVSSL